MLFCMTMALMFLSSCAPCCHPRRCTRTPLPHPTHATPGCTGPTWPQLSCAGAWAVRLASVLPKGRFGCRNVPPQRHAPCPPCGVYLRLPAPLSVDSKPDTGGPQRARAAGARALAPGPPSFSPTGRPLRALRSHDPSPRSCSCGSRRIPSPTHAERSAPGCDAEAARTRVVVGTRLKRHSMAPPLAGLPLARPPCGGPGGPPVGTCHPIHSLTATLSAETLTRVVAHSCCACALAIHLCA